VAGDEETIDWGSSGSLESKNPTQNPQSRRRLIIAPGAYRAQVEKRETERIVMAPNLMLVSSAEQQRV
jgi:hypothetical protein